MHLRRDEVTAERRHSTVTDSVTPRLDEVTAERRHLYRYRFSNATVRKFLTHQRRDEVTAKRLHLYRYRFSNATVRKFLTTTAGHMKRHHS